MHISSTLSPTEQAFVETALAGYLASKGPFILGAELGQFVTQAIRPRTVKQLGGLKKIAATDLEGLLQETAPDPDAVDVVYEILPSRVQRPLPQDLANAKGGVMEVAGKSLWRIFSNPRRDNDLLVDGDGRIFASAPGAVAPETYQQLAKPTEEQFRALAEQFADSQTDLAQKSFLKAALAPEDYYDGWIKELRRLRGPSSNLLREWETLKSEYVAKQLHDSLLACNADNVRATEIVRLARPNVYSNAVAHSAPAVAGQHKASHPPSQLSSAGAELSELRNILHHAIDLMSFAELRELKISAGVYYDATQQAKLR
ncbi:hypothetical protein [Ralstonia sp. NFACC01]|uniref:hypothetical protein n=1 Tax=Ralstonia sp. NFACC01 TaxID=1566294 RepID=UPI0008E4ECB9|nr:hypothetical protein [Ralstonia sp. NFACC01]SFO86351.1 hypothetical protein SAMN03159417_00377 [Ralstonia sp. NFACC01]